MWGNIFFCYGFANWMFIPLGLKFSFTSLVMCFSGQIDVLWQAKPSFPSVCFFFLYDKKNWIDDLHQVSSKSDDKQCSNFTDQIYWKPCHCAYCSSVRKIYKKKILPLFLECIHCVLIFWTNFCSLLLNCNLVFFT